MLDSLEYTRIAGADRRHSVVIYSLSTCGFCKRAMSFLGTHGIEYCYIHMDKIPLETKTEAKKALKAKFNQDVAFPFAVVDDREPLVGFIEADWKRTLEL
ncbi:MAG TPA: glutaredoxin domain-containing protein [Magnetospirillaceae bacterium]|nr:glutaredoxin domain-containing protein [Magnetospirillaceae bacterium]